MISIRGELDVGAAPMLREWLELARLQGDARIILNLVQLEFVDLSSMTVLLDAQEQLMLEGRSMMVVCNRPWILRVFSMTGASELLPVVARVEDAMPLSSRSASEGPG